MRIGSQTVAVITGAASGIGRALASELGSRGATLALTDIDRTGLDAVAAMSTRCSTHVCDVADPEAVHIVSKAIVAAHGAVHVLINNAGISVAGTVEDLTLADFHRAFLPHLRAAAGRGDGAAVCNVLSDFALFSIPTRHSADRRRDTTGPRSLPGGGAEVLAESSVLVELRWQIRVSAHRSGSPGVCCSSPGLLLRAQASGRRPRRPSHSSLPGWPRLFWLASLF